MRRKYKKKGLERYETTLILLSILLAVMSIIMFMPFGHPKQADSGKINSYSK